MKKGICFIQGDAIYTLRVLEDVTPYESAIIAEMLSTLHFTEMFAERYEIVKRHFTTKPYIKPPEKKGFWSFYNNLFK